MQRGRLAFAAVAAAGLAGAPAGSAGTLVPTRGHVLDPQLTVSARGSAVALWTRDNAKYDFAIPLRAASGSTRPYKAKVEVAFGSLDGGFSRRQRLAVVHSPLLGGPLLAGSRSGDAVAAWQGDDRRLRFAVSRRGGRFAPPHVLARRGLLQQLVEEPGGRFALAWRRGATLTVATGFAGSEFRDRFKLKTGHDADLDLALNRRGTVAVLTELRTTRVWLRRPGAQPVAAGRVPGWTTSGAQVRLEPDDTVVAVLSGYRDEAGTAASYRRPGGAFTKPRVLDRTGTFPALAVDPSGAITAAWTLYSRDGAPRGVGAATAPPGGRFKRVLRFRRVGAWGGEVAAAAHGRRLVLFEQNGSRGGRESRLRALAYARHGGFGRPATVMEGAPADHAVGLADDGRGLALWDVERRGSQGGLFFARVAAMPRR